jgi:hypothetical protein
MDQVTKITHHNVEALCDGAESANAFRRKYCERSTRLPALVLPLVVESSS